MKIFANSKIALCTISVGLIVISFIVAPLRADDPPAPAKDKATEKIATDSLEPLGFLTGGEWEAKLPTKADGTHDSILAHFTWANNHRAIRISNSYAAAGKQRPYIDGLYTWHPGKRSIVFWYVGSDGSLHEGTVKPDHGVLVHEFQITDPKGNVSDYTSRATPDGADAWTNEISARHDGKLEPMVKVRYEKVK